MTRQPRIVVRKPIPRRQPSQLWEHTAVIGFAIGALMFVVALAR